MMNKKTMIISIILGFSLGMAICLEITNLHRTGGAIQSFNKEYEFGGSRKWRGTWADAFQTYILMPSLLVYPLAVVGIIMSIKEIIKQKDKGKKIFGGIYIIIFLTILIRFISLGVASVAVFT